MSDEDNELGIRMSPERELESDRPNSGTDNVDYQDRNAVPLFNEVNSIYAYEELDEDVELFISPTVQSGSKWKQEFRVARCFRFWAAAVTWIGMKAGSFFFWIMVPTLFLQRVEPDYRLIDWETLLVVAGVGSFAPSIASYWMTLTNVQYRRIYFGGACLLGSVILLGA